MRVLSALALILAVIVGLFASGIARELGFFRFVLQLKPDRTGDIPLFAEDLAAFKTLPDCRGKVALVTGANKGLGYATARLLAEKGAKVILACRDMPSCEKVAAKSRGMGFARQVDFSSLASVQAFAQSVLRDFERLDMLVLNAGMFPFEFNLTGDGLETTFAVNHVAPHLLFKILRPLLTKTALEVPGSRVSVVVVASRSHYTSYPDGVALTTSSLNDPSRFNMRLAYGQSKLANVLFAQEAAAQFKAEKIPVFVNSCHPGFVSTEIGNHILDKLAALIEKTVPPLAGIAKSVLAWIWDQIRLIMWSAEEGALTQAWLAASPERVMKGLENTGLYYQPIMKVVTPHAFADASSDLRRKLWVFTEELLTQKGF